MSSVLVDTGSPSPIFQDVNDNGGLTIIGKQDERSAFIIEGDGNDLVFGGNKGGFISTGAGNDIIIGGDGAYVLDGGEGNDIIIAGNGRNTVFGGDGSDIIFGGDGNDIINGGKGSDILFGGGGADVFQFDVTDFENGELDIILDFTKDEDRIQIGGAETVEYDSSTGIVSIDGKAAIFIDPDLDITAQDSDEDGTWELF
ncbi:MAG: calcium-binding protein [Pleurocapsa sp.]